VSRQIEVAARYDACSATYSASKPLITYRYYNVMHSPIRDRDIADTTNIFQVTAKLGRTRWTAVFFLTAIAMHGTYRVGGGLRGLVL
jgi:hypothetical protein